MSRSWVVQGRTAVVTGAARGLGAGLARRLADRGMSVALLGREAATLDAVARTLPTESLVVEVDVTDDASMLRASEDVTRRLAPPRRSSSPMPAWPRAVPSRPPTRRPGAGSSRST